MIINPQQLSFPDVLDMGGAKKELSRVNEGLVQIFEAKRGMIASLHSVGSYLLEQRDGQGSSFSNWLASHMDGQTMESAKRAMTIAKSISREDLAALCPTSIDRKTQALLTLEEPHHKQPSLPRPMAPPTAFCTNFTKWITGVNSRYGGIDQMPQHERTQCLILIRPIYEALKEEFEREPE